MKRLWNWLVNLFLDVVALLRCVLIEEGYIIPLLGIGLICLIPSSRDFKEEIAQEVVKILVARQQDASAAGLPQQAGQILHGNQTAQVQLIQGVTPSQHHHPAAEAAEFTQLPKPARP